MQKFGEDPVLINAAGAVSNGIAYKEKAQGARASAWQQFVGAHSVAISIDVSEEAEDVLIRFKDVFTGRIGLDENRVSEAEG